jgi:hypothetical protein
VATVLATRRNARRPSLFLIEKPLRELGHHRRREQVVMRRPRNDRQLIPAALRDAILASRPLRSRLGGSGSSLDGLVRYDFAHGRTVVVDGWVLSVTEARQCALFSLLSA